MKRFFSSVIIALMLVSLAGCGDNTTSNDIQESPPVHSSQEEQNNTPDLGESESSSPAQESKSQDGSEVQDTTEALDNILEKDVSDTIAFLSGEYEKLVTEVDTFDKYINSTERMEKFYTKVYEETQLLCIRLREYSIDYAVQILALDQSSDGKYDEMDVIYDNIYDDAGDEIYDEIYSGILDDMYDDFYDGILSDAYDTVPYKEWSDARSDEYDLWSDTRSEVYDEWSDCRSDIYDFWSDMRRELWNDDIEKAEQKIEKFEKDVAKLKNKVTSGTGQDSERVIAEVVPSDSPDNAAPSDSHEDATPSSNGLRPEFKETMDSYEAFFDEYVAFMQKYSESDNTLGMLSDYAIFMTRYAEAMEGLSEIGEEDLSTEELLYYTEVMGRINQKLLSVATG